MLISKPLSTVFSTLYHTGGCNKLSDGKIDRLGPLSSAVCYRPLCYREILLSAICKRPLFLILYKIIKISEVNILFNSIFYVRKHINKNVGGGSWVSHAKPKMNNNLKNQKCLYLHVNKWVQNGPFYPADELLNGL